MHTRDKTEHAWKGIDPWGASKRVSIGEKLPKISILVEAHRACRRNRRSLRRDCLRLRNPIFFLLVFGSALAWGRRFLKYFSGCCRKVMGGVYVLEGGEKSGPDGASLLLTAGERGGRSVSGPGVRKGVREERRVREGRMGVCTEFEQGVGD